MKFSFFSWCVRTPQSPSNSQIWTPNVDCNSIKHQKCDFFLFLSMSTFGTTLITVPMSLLSFMCSFNQIHWDKVTLFYWIRFKPIVCNTWNSMMHVVSVIVWSVVSNACSSSRKTYEANISSSTFCMFPIRSFMLYVVEKPNCLQYSIFFLTRKCFVH